MAHTTARFRSVGVYWSPQLSGPSSHDPTPYPPTLWRPASTTRACHTSQIGDWLLDPAGTRTIGLIRPALRHSPQRGRPSTCVISEDRPRRPSLRRGCFDTLWVAARLQQVRQNQQFGRVSPGHRPAAAYDFRSEKPEVDGSTPSLTTTHLGGDSARHQFFIDMRRWFGHRILLV